MPEPRPSQSTVSPIAVLLVNLGTPDAPTPSALRRYLRQFLSDPRVVRIPRLVWWPLLYGVILNTRPKASAERYARIWLDEGSPLKIHTERQAKLLRGYLGERIGARFTVEYAMRYGAPSIAETFARLEAGGARRILVIPLYPQYAESTTASVLDEVSAFLGNARNAIEVRLLKHFHDQPGYIRALANLVSDDWEKAGRPDATVISFHGLPQRAVDAGDPYRTQCELTARLLVKALGLADDRWRIAFQSRFGRARWLTPYTAATLQELARAGVRRVDVICPGFVSDCLETLEEIGVEGKQLFLEAGGAELHVLPCLNERDDWIRALADIVESQFGDWIDLASPALPA